MPTGTVKWFDPRKGFGFIVPDEGGDDIFVHYTGIQGDEGEFKTIHDNDKVEFNIGEGDKGPIAVDVVVTESAGRGGGYDDQGAW